MEKTEKSFTIEKNLIDLKYQKFSNQYNLFMGALFTVPIAAAGLFVAFNTNLLYLFMLILLSSSVLYLQAKNARVKLDKLEKALKSKL